MKLSTQFRHIRKGVLLFFVLTLLAGYSVHDAISHYTGMAFYAIPTAGCNYGASFTQSCHGASSNTTVIHIFTPDKIYAGTTDTFRISVSNPDSRDVAAGFDLDVNDTPGTANVTSLTAIPGTNTYVTTDTFFYDLSSLTQSAPQSFNGTDSAVWSFLVTVPDTPGTYQIYAAGNAVDGDSATADTEDHWNIIVDSFTVLPAPSIVTPSASGNVFQAYPNPATNEIFVNDGTLTDVGSYSLTDAAGRVVTSGNQIKIDGRHSIDVSKIAAGAYILNVQTRSGLSYTRSVVIRR
jgi:hypothetical protein